MHASHLPQKIARRELVDAEDPHVRPHYQLGEQHVHRILRVMIKVYQYNPRFSRQPGGI